MDIAQFHFLRPGWLLAILPLAAFLYLLWRRQRQSEGWRGAIDESLLPHLLDAQALQRRWNSVHIIGVAMLTALLALAGPAWDKLPQPVRLAEDALVILFDMSPSMMAEDVKPSRLVRSRQKLIDLLDRRDEGTVALIAYAGDEHVVSPLTDDNRTIANLLPALSPSMMPQAGNRPVRAVRRARELLEDAGTPRGHIVMVTDGLPARDVSSIKNALLESSYRLSVLGVGSAEGGPIPTGQGFLKGRDGEIIIARLNRAPLRQLTAATGGRYVDLSLDDGDLDALLANPAVERELRESSSRNVDIWQDMGFWLLPLLVPPMLAAFRRGWVLLLAVALLAPGKSMAFGWADLWATPDQQGAALLEQGEAAEAAARFSDPRWKAVANYRAGEYMRAAELYGQSDNADAWYNRGNSLARAGELASALDAYDEALLREPGSEDAQFNRDLVEQLLRQAQQQGQQGEGEQQQDEEGQQSQGQQSQGQEGEEQQSQGQQSEGQQSAGQRQDGAEGEEDGAQTAQGQQPPTDEEGAEEQVAAGKEQGEDGDEEGEQQGQQRDELSQEEMERVLVHEQWLRRIPDDPSGLLRRKFHYESQQSQQRGGGRSDEDRY